MALGWLLKRVFKFPAWTVPAICFNNTTALPLLLIQSLDTAGILKQLLKDDDDSTSDAVKRAKSYFLVSAIVGNSLTFAMGPKLLDDEEAPDQPDDKQNGNEQESSNDEESGRSDEDDHHENPRNAAGRTAEEQEEHTTEHTTLLPHAVEDRVFGAVARASKEGNRLWRMLPSFVQKTLSLIVEFTNAPLIGALIGGIIGLTPGLHTAFFSDPDKGGFFKAWLTTSIENVGDLFASLQLVVVGAKLSEGLTKAKNGESSGKVPWLAMVVIFAIRFILWPILSIGVIFLLASKTDVLTNDPILWFVMMLMPTGPPATKLTALADVSGADQEQKLAISKFLMYSYAVSPVICFAVVGSLKASIAASS